VVDVVAAHDLVLASGHLTCAEALVLFRAAHAAGVRRMLLNHPRMPFLRWDDAAAPELARLGVVLELGILPDILTHPTGRRRPRWARSTRTTSWPSAATSATPTTRPWRRRCPAGWPSWRRAWARPAPSGPSPPSGRELVLR
jgi:hypothetical protein